MRILVVEDNTDTAEMFRLVLQFDGHEVRVAYTGPTGLRAAKEWTPDVVLCDIGLPDLDGYGVVQGLRQDPATAGALVIAVTAYASDADRRRALSAGFDFHLAKPADFSVLRDLFARHLMASNANGRVADGRPEAAAARRRPPA